ncbi:MAG: DUF4382 domain-containing protein [Patescibacteria group bacterium]
MNNTIIGIIIAIVVILGGAYLITKNTKTTNNTTNISETNNNEPTPTPLKTEGKVIYSITDATADLSTISEINMTVTSTEMHSEANGWTTVTTTPYTYNLLALKANNENSFLASISAPTGTYDQVRLMVSSVMIKMKNGTVKEAKLPSGELKINTVLVVSNGETSSVNFDFMASKSLHVTGNGGYIFAPVVKTETKSSASVDIDTNNVVKIGGGHTDSDDTNGMDIDGTVKLNFELNTNAKFDVIDNIIKVKSVSSGSVY